MDFFKKIGATCRLHYEKLILILVLLGLFGAVVYLSQTKANEEQKIKDFEQHVTHRAPSPVKSVDTSANEAALKLIASPPGLNFSLPHHLFNPVKWQRRPPPETDLVKLETGKEVGWPKMVVSNI